MFLDETCKLMQITGRLKKKKEVNNISIPNGFYAIAEPIEALSMNEVTLEKNMFIIRLSLELIIDSFDK
jgi:hypothetical protein